jgi:hypothetical protein
VKTRHCWEAVTLSLRRQGLIQLGRDGLEEGEAVKLEMYKYIWKIKAWGMDH